MEHSSISYHVTRSEGTAYYEDLVEATAAKKKFVHTYTTLHHTSLLGT